MGFHDHSQWDVLQKRFPALIGWRDTCGSVRDLSVGTFKAAAQILSCLLHFRSSCHASGVFSWIVAVLIWWHFLFIWGWVFLNYYYFLSLVINFMCFWRQRRNRAFEILYWWKHYRNLRFMLLLFMCRNICQENL